MRNGICSFFTNAKIMLIPKSLLKKSSAYTVGGGQCSPHLSFEWPWPHSRLKSQKEKVQECQISKFKQHVVSRNFWAHLSKTFHCENQHCTTHQERNQPYSIGAAGEYVDKTSVITRAVILSGC